MSAVGERSTEPRATLSPEVLTLGALALVTALLGALAFWPSPPRLRAEPAPLSAPIAVDEPVIHTWK